MHSLRCIEKCTKCRTTINHIIRQSFLQNHIGYKRALAICSGIPGWCCPCPKERKKRKGGQRISLDFFFTQEWKVIGISNLVHSFPMAWIIHDASLRSRGQSRGHTKFGYKIYTGIDQRMHGELHIVSAIAVINIVVDSHRFFEYGKCYVVSNCIYNES